MKSLKFSREQAGFTQKEVEKTLGMRSLMIRDYEVGRLKLPVSVAIRLSELYDVSLEDMVGKPSLKKKLSQSKALVNFNSLFLGNGFSDMYIDPVIRAALEDRQGKVFEQSLFDLLIGDMSEKEKQEIVQDITHLLFLVASADGKINDEEIACIKSLLKGFKISPIYKTIVNSKELGPFRSKAFQRIEVRHFTIWILFFFALADETVCRDEIEMIDNCAEALKVNRSNYLFIKSKFLKEEL